jgi:DNA-binding transcriptional regulator LsrR (DeoR family)
MALGRKTGGRQKGAFNRATAEARAAAAATGILPLDYMLSVMRDDSAEPKRRDAMAIAAAPYLHQKLTPRDSVAVHVGNSGKPNAEDCGIKVVFVRPSPVPDNENSEASGKIGLR